MLSPTFRCFQGMLSGAFRCIHPMNSGGFRWIQVDSLRPILDVKVGAKVGSINVKGLDNVKKLSYKTVIGGRILPIATIGT